MAPYAVFASGAGMIMEAARDETVPFIKICGIQTSEEAILALDCGATALGFLVGLTHVAADGVAEHIARDIIARLPAGACTGRRKSPPEAG